jgi:hypothetical protein
MDSLSRAAMLKDEADHLLFDSGIEAILKKYGDVIYSGSYVLDLLAWRDLDIYLVLDDDPDPMGTLAKIVAEVVQRKDLLRAVIQLKTHLKDPFPKGPEGLYLGLKLGEDWPSAWKLDIWVVSPDKRAKNKADLERVRAALAPETRELILDIKNKLLTPEGRTPSLTGHNLYEAVLFRGLRSQTDICAYLKEHGVKL